MEINIKTTTLFLSIIITALSAGLFVGWVVSVIPGTRKITDQAYIETMQSINREILNPTFFSIFFGAIILMAVSTFFQYHIKIGQTFYLMLAATLIYLIGTFGVTMIGNVPLNNMIDALDLSTFTPKDFQEARLAFENKWNQFNLIRTVAALTSFILLLFAAHY